MSSNGGRWFSSTGLTMYKGELSVERYGQLRKMASTLMRKENAGHTLQPTALVHELVLRLMGQTAAPFHDEQHFQALCRNKMRLILIDHARRKRTVARTLPGSRVKVDEAPHLFAASAAEPPDRTIILADLIEGLAQAEPRAADAMTLCACGYSPHDIAGQLSVSLRTVHRDLAFARAWIADALAA